MDLDSILIADDEGAILELKHKGIPILKEDGSPVTITVASTESAKWKKARRTLRNKYIKIASPKNIKTTAEEEEEDTAFLLASVTLAWDGIEFDGGPKECTIANARALYLRYDWVKSQVDDFLTDLGNFTRASAKN